MARGTIILLSVFCLMFAASTVFLTYRCGLLVRTWLALRETETVPATIDHFRYERRGGRRPRKYMVVNYSIERDGHRERHQTSNIAPLAQDRNYFAAIERIFERQSEAVLHVSRSCPDVHAFSKDVNWPGVGVALLFPVVFGFGTTIMVRALARDFRSRRYNQRAQL